jgi:hypothetical protein
MAGVDPVGNVSDIVGTDADVLRIAAVQSMITQKLRVVAQRLPRAAAPRAVAANVRSLCGRHPIADSETSYVRTRRYYATRHLMTWNYREVDT